MARGPSSWASRHFTRRPSLGEGGHGSTILDDRCSFRESAMRCLLVFSLVVIIMPSVASAQDMTSLTRPGVVALMRHALAPGTGDPSGFDLQDCATQRNLNEQGRRQARRIGRAMRDAGVTFDAIWSSQWCRARDTARLLQLGDIVEMPPINSFFAGRGDRAAQTAAALEMILDKPAEARLLLVTHQVNIRALAGSFANAGEIIVTLRNVSGGLTVIDRIAIEP